VTGDSEKFARLGRPRRVWAIGAAHGAVDRLVALHDHVLAHFAPGDRLVYLGNLIGHSDRVHALVDEVLSVRRSLIARPGVLAEDVVFLRGAQEEMWQKMLQLQFAPNPQDVLRWMLAQGVEPTLRAYGGRAEEGLAAAREGAIRLTRWTNALRESIRSAPGHNALYAALRRAAFTERGGTDGGAEGGAPGGGGALFVSAAARWRPRATPSGGRPAASPPSPPRSTASTAWSAATTPPAAGCSSRAWRSPSIPAAAAAAASPPGCSNPMAR
jgi:hypothetical protein